MIGTSLSAVAALALGQAITPVQAPQDLSRLADPNPQVAPLALEGLDQPVPMVIAPQPDYLKIATKFDTAQA